MWNMQELKAAAERCHRVEKNAEAGDSCWISRVYDETFGAPRGICWNLDKRNLAKFASILLSDAPVTAEWLREKWGFDWRGINRWWLDRRINGDQWMACSVKTNGTVEIVTIGTSNGIAVSTQGQFTMLALGLGLKPKEVSECT